MGNDQNTGPDRHTEVLGTLLAALDDPGPARGTVVELVETDEETLVGFRLAESGAAPSHLVEDGHLLERLAELAAAGDLAGNLLRSLVARNLRDAEQVRERARADAVSRFADQGPVVYDLEPHPDLAGSWRLPAPVRQTSAACGRAVVRVTDPPARSWGWAPAVAALSVEVDDLVLGTVVVDVDGGVEARGAYATASFDRDLLGRDRVKALVESRPWPAKFDSDVCADPVTALAHLADVGDETHAWVRLAAQARVEEDEARRGREEEAVEWGRLSRSKDRIPSAALAKWMREVSSIDYSSTGLRTGGWEVVSHAVVGRRRPAHLDARRGGRRKAVGVAEVLYVARLENRGVYGRSTSITFGDREVEKLRAVLPGCVVRVPEDRRAVFVAVDAPEHVAELDAAVVEWVMLGDDDRP